MARTEFVRRAQQRYATKPVLDEDGNPKRVPVTRNGQQLTTKRGALRWQTVTVRDLDRPLPMPQCDYPGCEDREIKVGTPYRYVEQKFRTRYRHAEHPSWQPWDLSSAMWARIAQVVDTAETELDNLGEFEDESDVESVLQSAAEEARSLAEERTEAADNMEEGFGHETEKSEELRQHAQNIEDWADELERWSYNGSESAPEPDDFHFDEAGEDYEDEDYEPDEGVPAAADRSDDDRYNAEGDSLADAWSTWRESVLDEAREVLQETPEV